MKTKIKLSYYDYQEKAKQYAKEFELTRAERNMLEIVFFWAINKQSLDQTVAVVGREARTLQRVCDKTELCVLSLTDGGNWTAILSGEYEWELDDTSYNC